MAKRKQIHVNQHVIKKNAKGGEYLPPLTVKTYKDNTRCFEVDILGPCKVVYRPDKPLSCGAKVWIETRSTVVPIGPTQQTVYKKKDFKGES